MLDGLVEALSSVDARCVVLTGEGTVFSAGYDIADLAPERLAEEAAELLTHPFEAALAALDAVAVPVVAALGGHAFGGGLELARGVRPADLRAGRPPGDAAGAARRRLLAHRAAALRRRDRLRPHPRALPHRPAGQLGRGARVGPRQRGHVGPGGAGRRAGERDRRAGAAVGARQQARAAGARPAAGPGAGGRAARRCATRPSAPTTSPRACAPSSRNGHRNGGDRERGEAVCRSWASSFRRRSQPVGSYVAARVSRGMLYVSGQGPAGPDGLVTGQVGGALTTQPGRGRRPARRAQPAGGDARRARLARPRHRDREAARHGQLPPERSTRRRRSSTAAATCWSRSSARPAPRAVGRRHGHAAVRHRRRGRAGGRDRLSSSGPGRTFRPTSPLEHPGRAAAQGRKSGCWISRTAWTSSISSVCTSACGWSPDRRARGWCWTGGRCCCCAPGTRSGSRTIRRCARRPRTRRCAGASGRARRACRAGR